MAPKWLATFVVEEPLKTAALGGDCFIPPGIYTVADELRGGITAHVLMLREKSSAIEMFVEAGYASCPDDLSANTKGGTCIDWRGVKKYTEKEAAA